MPSFLHAISENQPITPIIETVRGLLTGTPIGDSG
jgi:ABC-2 type transport system permease protein